MNKRKLVTDRRPGWIGPYGAADMNQDVSLSDRDDDILRLQKYKDLVILIANDYYELSYEKARMQRDDWRKRAQQLVEELEN